ncbi:hypothetical protein PFLA_a0815 [Pseudoalteromonas flavipulchra NCIMB 2033 = ATCC BAA-314]|nr:hypothetical protein [Pseudoalteromonas flavipulchra NCIMB 2033 = ATCC BAA-314]
MRSLKLHHIGIIHFYLIALLTSLSICYKFLENKMLNQIEGTGEHLFYGLLWRAKGEA